MSHSRVPFLVLSLLALAAAAGLSAPASADVRDPILMVISNQDYSHPEYAPLRASLEAAGLEVVVAAATTETATSQGGDGGVVIPDLALMDVEAEAYRAIVFVGGWGSSMYQSDFPGTYDRPEYRPDALAASAASRLIARFLARDKPVAAVGYGVSVLAWARVEGQSPIAGRTVVAFAGGVPAFRLHDVHSADAEVPTRWQIEANGATMLTSGSIGDPMTTADDVVVDGRIITAASWQASSRLAEVIAQSVAGR